MALDSNGRLAKRGPWGSLGAPGPRGPGGPPGACFRPIYKLPIDRPGAAVTSILFSTMPVFIDDLVGTLPLMILVARLANEHIEDFPKCIRRCYAQILHTYSSWIQVL